MKKKNTRQYTRVSHDIHYHHLNKLLPKVFYHTGSLFPVIFLKSIFLFMIVGFLGYFLVHNLSPETTDSSSFDTEKMLFSLEGSPEDWGIDSSSLNTHGAAANEFDFLFTESAQNVVSNQPIDRVTGSMLDKTTTDTGIISDQKIKENVATTTGIIVDPQIDTTSLSPTVVSRDVIQNTDVVIYQDLALHIDLVNSLFTFSILSSGQNIGGGSSAVGTEPHLSEIDVSDPISSVTLPFEDTASCKTPWGEILEHKDLVLAYKQRTDVNSLCNVQKRYCFNGKLTGSYPQKSCKEDLKYTYQEITPIAENDPKAIDPFIQPDPPKLSGATFDVHGKINTTSQARDTWSDSSKAQITSTGPYVQTISSTGIFCTTPWGETLTNGKFIKAYRSPIGLIDMPCEVELRLCTNSILKGSFTQHSCFYKNMTYSDYLLDKGENTNEPNTIDMINSVSTQSQKNTNTNTSFWNKLSTYF